MVVKLLELHFLFLILHIEFHFSNVSKVQNTSIFSESFKYFKIGILCDVFYLYNYLKR